MRGADKIISKVDEHSDAMCIRFLKYWSKLFPTVQMILRFTCLVPFQGKFEIFGFIYRYFSLFVALISTVLWILKEKKKTDIAISALIESIFQLIVTASMIFGYMYFRASKKKIYRSITRLWYSYDEDFQNDILVIVRRGYRIASIQMISILATFMIYSSAPVAVPLFFALVSSGNQTFEKSLPVRQEFLVDEDRYFYIIFAYQFISLMDFSLLICAMNFVFFTFLVGIIGGIHGLKQFLKKMDAEYHDRISTSPENAVEWICLQIKDFIRYHQALIDFYEFACELFSPIMFIVLYGASCSIILTSTAMVVLMESNFTQVPSMIVASFMSMMIVIFACTPSQLLKNASDDLFLTSCKLNYQNYPPKVRKTFLFIIMKVEKSFVLLAGPLVELNFETCSTIINSSFSYAATFRSFYTSK